MRTLVDRTHVSKKKMPTSIMSDAIHKTIAIMFGWALNVDIIFLIVPLLFIIILNLKTAIEMAR